MRRFLPPAPTWPAVLLVIGLLFLPLTLLLRLSLYESAQGRGFYSPGTFTFEHYATIADRHGLAIVRFTVLFAAAVAVTSLILAYLLSLWIDRLRRPFQILILLILLLPKTAGLLATLYGLQRMLPRGLLAAYIGEVYLILPYSVLVIFLQMQSLPRDLIMAARGLGASPFQAFCRITWPLSRPGVILALELGFLWGLSGFLGPLFLGGPNEMTIGIEIHRQAFEYGRWPRAAAHGVTLMLLTLIALLIRPVLRRES